MPVVMYALKLHCQPLCKLPPIALRLVGEGSLAGVMSLNGDKTMTWQRLPRTNTTKRVGQGAHFQSMTGFDKP